MTSRAISPYWAVPVLIMLTSCGRESTPTAPSVTRSFLEGSWTGTLTIQPEGRAATSGPTTWTFVVLDGTNLQTFDAVIQSQHAWLPITMTVTSAITPSNQPPARLSTEGHYISPRGCVGSILSVGNVTARSIDADFSGVDCPSPEGATFTGRVSLTKFGG
jgi:hypothetical protein